MKEASKNPKLCVTLLRQNAHLPSLVNSAFASVASLDFGVFRGFLIIRTRIAITALLLCLGCAASLSALSVSDLSIPVPRLRSAAFIVKNQRTDELLLTRRADTAQPIASITKLMTAMTILDGRLDMDEEIVILEADKDRLRNSQSRLPVGTKLTRHETLQLALMSSDNRAAHALGRTWPSGLEAFVEAMNRKARALGLENTRFVEPTGLSEANVSSALDLERMVDAACGYPEIRDLTTRRGLLIQHKKQQILFGNTNALVGNSRWEIGVSKTGYINDAGYCLVMQMNINGEPIIVVLLNSSDERARIEDAQRIRQWLEGPKPARQAKR
jgi:D-alanyl-D-alanine endopeptidase (penicillin-binding protein 7)